MLCDVFSGLSEEKKKKQRKTEHEKVNIEEIHFRPLITYLLCNIISLLTYMCLAGYAVL